jgi:cytochrome c5
MKATTLAIALSVLVLASLGAAATPPGKNANTVAAIVTNNDNADTMRVQGELRFRTNCGRCHAAPHKFPPRMMATIVRHMRVRATITDEDMRLVLFYMTQ